MLQIEKESALGFHYLRMKNSSTWCSLHSSHMALPFPPLLALATVQSAGATSSAQASSLTPLTKAFFTFFTTLWRPPFFFSRLVLTKRCRLLPAYSLLWSRVGYPLNTYRLHICRDRKTSSRLLAHVAVEQSLARPGWLVDLERGAVVKTSRF
jgi:hypothetical protein